MSESEAGGSTHTASDGSDVVDPDLVERKLAAILGADVSGYSRLISEDEAGTIRTLTGKTPT